MIMKHLSYTNVALQQLGDMTIVTGPSVKKQQLNVNLMFIAVSPRFSDFNKKKQCRTAMSLPITQI